MKISGKEVKIIVKDNTVTLIIDHVSVLISIPDRL